MEHGGVLVESGRARRASPDPRPHGGGCCSGTGDSRSSRGAARAVWRFSDRPYSRRERVGPRVAQAGMIRRFGFHTVASTSYEALTAFEYDSASLNQSINAWDYVLRSWGYDTNTSFIEFALRMDPNFLHYPPPVQHRKVIANFPEVRKTILDTHDRKLTGLLRL